MQRRRPKLRPAVQKRLFAILNHTFVSDVDEQPWILRHALVCRQYATTMWAETHKIYVAVVNDQVNFVRNEDHVLIALRLHSRFLAFFFCFARRVRRVDLELSTWEPLSADYFRFAATFSRLLEDQPKVKKLFVSSWAEGGRVFLSLLPGRITILTCSLREIPTRRFDQPLDSFVCNSPVDDSALYYALRVPARRIRIWEYRDQATQVCKLSYFAHVGQLPANPHLLKLKTYVNLVPEQVCWLGEREDAWPKRLDAWRRGVECFKRVNPRMALSFQCLDIDIRGIRQLSTFRNRLRLIQDRAQELVDLAQDEVGIKVKEIFATISINLGQERKCPRFMQRMDAAIARERRWREEDDFYRGTAVHLGLFWMRGNPDTPQYDEDGPAEWADEAEEGRVCVSERMVEIFESFLAWPDV